jgi:hypothetical protein
MPMPEPECSTSRSSASILIFNLVFLKHHDDKAHDIMASSSERLPENCATCLPALRVHTFAAPKIQEVNASVMERLGLVEERGGAGISLAPVHMLYYLDCCMILSLRCLGQLQNVMTAWKRTGC